MGKTKKFGTFAGVFTPSILTILGVIMYMRLGWVVGQAGLIYTLAIIFVAHIISITTGLSISSIATDKKIRTGGIYYMLSRSLGLPAGGAIGLTIFVGTALSISLYIIGFAESFLALDSIAEFLNLPPGVTGYRIVGSAVIVALVILAFISTSVAIKTQFVILGAMALSIISIVVGLFLNIDYHPQHTAMDPIEGGKPLAVIFGIFFPAATGFTAGVAMSGDLKNPKNSIPKGTMLAIGVGLVVYIAMAILFAVFVSRDMLVNDTDFILKIAWFSPLVIAGIWGATLSSALGGILGAPRIMQAISMDKIGPRIFAKGYGKGNEPRNALILTFIIAEAGILIGELNVIAGVVSMFYIAAYGFINLAFTLENWASTDFRPSFKVNRWFGIVGFIACFAVMYELDPLTMMAAIIIIAIIYLFLRRQKLKSEFGDVWTSVWNTLTKSALARVNRRQLEERNWRPNIILFSGGTAARPYLVDFGQWLSGKHGFLSNFDLSEKTNEQSIIPTRDYDVKSTEKRGVFTRNHVCTDIYEGIETIAKTYGFSGIEPNTVLMGWARQSKNPERFVQMLDNLYKLDLNVMMLDYDNNKGFGKHKKIDLFVTPSDMNGVLPLYVVRFLWYTDVWAKSTLRIFVLNDSNDDAKTIYRSVSNLLDKVRIDGEISVLNNHFEKKPHHEIILKESMEADLIILGIPDFSKSKSEAFIDTTNILCRDLGSVLLVKSSSEFQKLNLSYKKGNPAQLEAFHKTSKEEIPDLIHPEIRSACKPALISVKKTMESYGNDFATVATHFDKFYHDILNDCKIALSQTDETQRSERSAITIRRAAYRKLILNLRAHYSTLEKETLPAINAMILNTPEKIAGELLQIVKEAPNRLEITLGKESITQTEYDIDASKAYRIKLEKYLQNKGKGKVKSMPVQRILNREIVPGLANLLSENEKNVINLIIANYVSIEQLHDTLIKSYISFNSEYPNHLHTQEEAINEIASIISKSINDNNETTERLVRNVDQYLHNVNKSISVLLNQPVQQKQQQKLSTLERQLSEHINGTEERISNWEQNQNHLFNSMYLELNLMLIGTTLESSSHEITDAIDNIIEKDISAKHKSVIKILQEGDISIQKLADVIENEEIRNESKTKITHAFNRLQRKILRFPETFYVLSDGFMNEISERVYEEPEILEVKSRQLLDHMFQQEFTVKVRKSLNHFMKIYGESILKEHDIITRLSVSGFSENEKQEFINSHTKILESEIKILEEQKEVIKAEINRILEIFSGRLSLQPFLRTAGNLKHYIRNREREDINNVFTRSIKTVKCGIRDLLTNLWYRQSRGVLLHNRLISADNAEKKSESLARITAQMVNVIPVSEIPFYYRQLFMRKQQYAPEFWIGRDKEIQDFEIFHNRYKQRRTGAILVTGEQFSGNTYFCEHVAAIHADSAPIFMVTPPVGGTTSKKSFYATLADSLESENKSWEEALIALPINSIIIFDNIELWWTRTEGGNQVLDIIKKVIEKYADKILFIANTGRVSYNIIKKVSTIDEVFSGEICLMPFDTRQIETIIMRRHRAGGIKFSLNGRHENNFRPWHFARLFSRYFNFSNGNIGIALASWISNIQNINGNILEMKSPSIPEDIPIEKLEEITLFSLVQLIIHRQATAGKLSRIMQIKKEEAANVLDNLHRKDLVNVNDSGIYEINPVLYRFIIERLKKAELL